jgi:hypothetical protein
LPIGVDALIGGGAVYLLTHRSSSVSKQRRMKCEVLRVLCQVRWTIYQQPTGPLSLDNEPAIDGRTAFARVLSLAWLCAADALVVVGWHYAGTLQVEGLFGSKPGAGVSAGGVSISPALESRWAGGGCELSSSLSGDLE